MNTSAKEPLLCRFRPLDTSRGRQPRVRQVETATTRRSSRTESHVLAFLSDPIEINLDAGIGGRSDRQRPLGCQTVLVSVKAAITYGERSVGSPSANRFTLWTAPSSMRRR